jgi:hypothetical protein
MKKRNMKYIDYTLELGAEDQRCYAGRLLTYEMSRDDMKKLDFHKLLRDVESHEMAEKGREYLLADSDSYTPFDPQSMADIWLTEGLINESETIEFENECISSTEGVVRLLFFLVYDEVSWASSSFSLPESCDIDQVRFCANWHWTGAIKWLENIEVISLTSQLKITDFTLESDSIQSVSYKNKLYCALMNEEGDMETRILNTMDDTIPEELYGLKE